VKDKFCNNCSTPLIININWKEYHQKNWINTCTVCINKKNKIEARKKYKKNKEKFISSSKKCQLKLKNNNPKLYKAREMRQSAKGRSKKKNLDFNITVEDIYSIMPDYCPILKSKLTYSGNKDKNSASLDRIDSSKGYTKENIQIISQLANMMKSNSNEEEQLLFANYIFNKNKK